MTVDVRSKIPNTAHFVWFGESLPLVYILGIKSALVNGGFDSVVLHLDQELSDNEAIREYLEPHSRFEIRLINEDYFTHAGDAILEMYQGLTDRRARSNVLRLVILAKWGGVYLDTDVVVLKDFAKHREDAFFYGNQWNRYPFFSEQLPRLILKICQYFHGVLRFLLLLLPYGFFFYNWYERRFLYPLPNNCVIGSTPDHSFLHELFQHMLDLDPEIRIKNRQLGVRLFQRGVAYVSDENKDRIKGYSCSVFNPLSPVISRLWFKKGFGRYQHLFNREETTLIHWYSTSLNIMNPKIIRSITAEGIDQDADTVALFPFLKAVKDFKEVE
ncbi:MAG: glycosyltransferase [Coraliomargaritaceae bacterium]